MELPNIIEKITHQEEREKREYFFALQIWDEGVKSAIWTIEEKGIKVVVLGSQEEWEGGVDELIAAVDKSLSVAFERFEGIGEEPSRVIFGLSDDWISGDKIIPEKQEMLSALCQRLDLKPIGFVSIFDALNYRIKEIEGVPPSMILINLGKKAINLAVIEAGKIYKVEKVLRSDNLGADVYEGLLRFEEVENLPSRMVLFNGEETEEARQILISFPWQTPSPEGKELSFLHFPKVEILPYDFDINAISLVGGKETAAFSGFKVDLEPKEREKKESLEFSKEKEFEKGEKEDNLGFVKGKDVAYFTPKMPKEEEIQEEGAAKKTDFLVEEEKPKTKPFFEFIRGNFFGKKIFGFFSSFLRPLEIGGGIIFLIALSLLFFLWNIPQAKITVFFSPQVLEKELEIIIDPNQETIDEKNLILPGQVIEVEIGGEKNISTTGKKTVGEKARGEITIYNRTDTKKVFPEGTIIIGPGELKFVLDREVEVASKTPNLETGVDEWGEAKVEVSAFDIGAQYNLAANSQFRFKDFPTTSFLGKNESAFTGGSSREISAVSEEDQKNLQKKLLGELEENAKNEILLKVPQGKKLVEEAISSSITSVFFDHKVGEEAQTLNLKLKVKFSGLVFDQKELLGLIKNSLSSQIPENFEFKDEEILTRFEFKEKKNDGSVLFSVFLQANLLPKLDTAEIIKNIKGKRPKMAKSYFSNISGFSDLEISFSPKLPKILEVIPKQEDKISLELRSRK